MVFVVIFEGILIKKLGNLYLNYYDFILIVIKNNYEGILVFI